MRKDLGAHVNICLLTPQICKYCGAEHVRGEMTKHLRTCQAYPIVCPKGCREVVPRSNLPRHLEHCQETRFSHFTANNCFEIFNMEEQPDEVLRDWFKSLEFDPTYFTLTRVDQGRVFVSLSEKGARLADEGFLFTVRVSFALLVCLTLEQGLFHAFSSRSFPYVRTPIFSEEAPLYTFCPPITWVDCPFHTSYFGNCPFRHKASVTQACRYWKIGVHFNRMEGLPAHCFL